MESNSEFNLTTVTCTFHPPFVNSDGLWTNIHRHQWWLNNSLPLLELQLVLFCFFMAIIHFLLKRSGVSKISSQIITGLIFGCSWGKLDKGKFKLFRVESEEILGLFSYFAYMLFMFITAVKMDVSMTMKTGKRAWIIGLPSILMPLTCGLLVSSFLLEGLTISEIRKLPLMVSMQSMISFPVIACLLNELKIVSTELGRLGLSSALVADMFSQCAVAIANQIRISRKNAGKGYYSIGGLCVQVFMVSFLFRPAVLWIMKQTPEGKPASRSTTQTVFLVVLLSAVTSTLLGQPAVVGPYLLGLSLTDGGPMGFSLIEKLECFVSDFFMPVFVITCALQVDLSQILLVAVVDDYTRVNIILAFVTYVTQFFCTFLTSLYCQLSFRDSLMLSLILGSKGVVELSFCTLFTEYNIISRGILAWFTVFLLLIATFVPIMLKCLNDISKLQASNQNRNIMHLSQNSEFRVLACVHKNENIYGFIHLLNISCPTLENPVAVYALHLIELVGRTTPVFISHRIENKPIGDQTYSENMLLSFDHFEKDNSGSVYAECFTSISPHKFMHNDICKLAMDKITSLIILPFHITWTSDGLIDQEDNTMRNLNCCVIEKAPCSVAILADKGHLGSIASMASSGVKCEYTVCVIYMGGSDDREAISFAKRLAKDIKIELTVLKLGSSVEDNGTSKWEKMLDSEVIKDFKMTCLGDGRVKFLEEVSEDGPQTALRLRELVNDFDLMIVGRRKGMESSPQTSGLSEWNEFPELGILGDLIASLDINTRTSVLVIQQQK
ncbi:cation/H(+) antiporter 4-like [Cucumis melo var. makuwa]|uniref:Cation/H(+) antiporter 4-like n=1 Tax=Cucumis melo var. makuwa TaxID=1194695 RepID=A0A5A7UAF3_CUCMM|nr:cation/H(+) antiporter 4-like [Cucumis melo var. makuwa]